MNRAVVYVRWHDAIHPTGEWERPEEFDREPDMVTETVGWLAHRSRKAIQVAVTCAGRGTEDEQLTGIMTIPMGCVERIVEIPVDGKPAKVIFRKRGK
jgi:hypothetical protein